jgi:hypothetical protein
VVNELSDSADSSATERQALSIECSKKPGLLTSYYVPNTVYYPKTAYYPKQLDTCDPADLLVHPEPSTWLHQTNVSVVVALGHKIKSVHWLEKLAEHEQITVFVYYCPVNVRPELKAHLQEIVNPRFVKIENRFAWQHTEAYAYLVHILVFTAHLSGLTVFLQDDTCDEEYRLECGDHCGANGHTHDIVEKVLNISRANPPVQFLPLSTTSLGKITYTPVARSIDQAENMLPPKFTSLFYNESQMASLRQLGHFFSWKNGLFAVSRARIMSHPMSAYVAAIRLCEEGDARASKTGNPLNRNKVGYTFERTWQDIFSAPACQFKWSGCKGCPQDCGSCSMSQKTSTSAKGGKQMYIAC